MTKSPQLNDAQRTAIQLVPKEHVIKLVAFPDEGDRYQYTPATIPNLDAILKAHGIRAGSGCENGSMTGYIGR